VSIFLPKYLNPSAVRSGVLQVLLVVSAWVIFYHVSVDLMVYFAFNDETFWVFLPAGIRLVAVIIFGWVGVLGLFIGNVLTPDNVPLSQVLLLSASSALAPKLALITCRRLLQLTTTLEALKPIHLMLLTLVASSYNAIIRVGLLHFMVYTQPLFNVLPMFVGDLVGTFIIFYLAVFSLWLARRWFMPPL
jgi:hypothetical protein